MFRQFIISSLVGIFCFSSAVASQKCSSEDLQYVEDGRITFSHDQIHLTKNGIFINVDGHFIAVETIHADSEGNYYCDFQWVYECPRGHPYLFYQSGCSVEGCPFYAG